MIIDAVLFPVSLGREGKILGKKVLRPGEIAGHPFRYKMGYKENGDNYCIMISNAIKPGTVGEPMGRTALDAYDWYKHGKFYIGELKDGSERRT